MVKVGDKWARAIEARAEQRNERQTRGLSERDMGLHTGNNRASQIICKRCGSWARSREKRDGQRRIELAERQERREPGKSKLARAMAIEETSE
jgi:hypothetical protein